MAISEYVIKVASRCNLNCSYCYMYNMGDTTYMNQPKFMSIHTIQALAKAIDRHCRINSLPLVYIAFHGGEPLLADKEFFEECVHVFNDVISAQKQYVIQTNGILLDATWMDLFNKLNIQVGISVDGPKRFHDAYRVHHNNKGSFEEVVNGIKMRNEKSVGGLISVINTQIPPRELYDFYLSVGAKTINILLPDNHYNHLPPGITNPDDKDQTPYGNWMAELYDIWANHNESSRPRIRFFENIIGIIMGYEQGDELIGKRKNMAITIETDGAIEIVDPLRICENGFTRNNLNVKMNEISDIEVLPIFQAYYHAHENLCEQCRSCAIQNVCGGGYLGHRYSREKKFDNPSVYCKDLMKLICHIRADVISRLPPKLVEELKMQPISYDELFDQVHPENAYFI